jgi:hypothetical protein
MALFSVVSRRGLASTTARKCRLRQIQVPVIQLRNLVSTSSFMFAKPLSFAPEEAESRLLLILGKPGGGKGTISEKILEVCNSKLCSIMPMMHPRDSLFIYLDLFVSSLNVTFGLFLFHDSELSCAR